MLAEELKDFTRIIGEPARAPRAELGRLARKEALERADPLGEDDCCAAGARVGERAERKDRVALDLLVVPEGSGQVESGGA